MGQYHRADSTSYYDGDVIDDWDQEEEDSDDEGMRYGDWESDEPEPIYQRPELEVLPNPRTHHPSYLRETVAPHRAPISRPTRDLRNIYTTDTHAPVGMPTLPTPLPHSTARTQDIQPYQRVTQPLSPKIISGLEREHGLRVPDVQRAGSGKITPAMPSRDRILQTHQLPEPPATLMPAKSICLKCQGAGYLRADVPFGDPHFGKAIACECKEAERRAKRRQQLREMSNLDALRDQNFQTFNARVPGVQEAYKATLAFAENSEGWLLLVGPNGCGKTHLAAAIANQALDSGAVVLFEPVPDLLDHLRAAFAPSSNEVYDQLFAKMREAEVLILDDLGAQQSSSWASEKLFQLLNYRYNMGMPTVITANLKGIQGVDERIRSRLSDAALVLTVHMDRAYDYRPKRPNTKLRP
jgi:DNA replication protein DnaC